MHQHSPCNDVSSVRCGILRIVGKLPAKLHPVPRLQKQLISPTSPKSVSLYINFDTSVIPGNSNESKLGPSTDFEIVRHK